MSQRQLYLLCTGLCLIISSFLSAQLTPEKLPVADEYAKIIIDDNNLGPNLEPGFIAIKPEVFRFSKPGDIIVIHGSGTQVDVPTTNAKLLNINGTSIEKYEGVPNMANPNYEGGQLITDQGQRIADYISFAPNQNFIQAKVGKVYANKTTLSSAKNYSLNTTDMVTYGSLPPTLGGPNNAGNGVMIDGLTNTSSSSEKMKCNLFGAEMNNVKIVALGDPTFKVTTSFDPPDIEERLYESNHIQLYNLDCGDHIITVKNGTNSTRKCTVHVKKQSPIKVNHCAGVPLNISEKVCGDIDSDCITVQIGDGPGQKYSDLGSIPDVDLNEDETITITMGDSQGNTQETLFIEVSIYKNGDSCDDGDPCTIDDIYTVDVVNETCNCAGTTLAIPIITEESDPPCTDVNRKLSVQADDFDDFVWFVTDYDTGEKDRLNAGPEVQVYKAGKYNVVASREGGCRKEIEYVVASKEAYDHNLTVTPSRICEGGEATIILDGNCTDISWDNSTNTSNTHIVASPGTYTVSFKKNDCEHTASIEVESLLGDISIKPDNPILCNSLELSLHNLPLGLDLENNIGSIEWEVPAGYPNDPNSPNDFSNEEKIPALVIGTYTATVTDDSGCNTLISTEVKPLDLLDLEQTLIDNGFREIALFSPLSAKGGGTVRSLTCKIGLINSQDYNAIFEEGGELKSLRQYLKEQIPEVCACNGEEQGFIMDDVCKDAVHNLDYLLDADVSIKAFVWKEGTTEKIYVWEKEDNCYSGKEPNRKVFNQEFNKILCAIYSGESTLKLTETFNTNPGTAIPGSDIFSGFDPLFDNNRYSVSGNKGIHIGNYFSDETLDLSGIDWSNISVTNNFGHRHVEEWCEESDHGGYRQIFIPYSSNCDLLDLTITVKDDYAINFLELFSGTATFVESLILGKNTVSAEQLELLPLCYLSECEDHCELLNLCTTLDNPADAILHLTDKAFAENTDCILKCYQGKSNYNDEWLVAPFMNHKHNDREERTDILSNAYYHYLSKNKIDYDTDANTKGLELDGVRHLKIFGPQYNPTYEDEVLLINKVNAVISHYPVEFPDRPFDYFQNYPVHLGGDYDFLKDFSNQGVYRDADTDHVVSAGFNGVIYLPGIYLAYAIERQKSNQNVDDIFTLIDLVSMAVGYGVLSSAIKLHRARKVGATYSLAMGTGEVITGAAGVFLEQGFCRNPSDPQVIEFCKVAEPIVTTINLLMLGDVIASSRIKEFVDAKKVFDVTEPHRLETYLDSGDNGERYLKLKNFFEIFDDLPQLILKALDETKLGTIDLDYLIGWVEAVPDPQYMLLIIEEVNALEDAATVQKI